MILRSLGAYRDIGLLLLRIGVGASFILVHGGPKLLGGPETWTKVGGAMGHLGITFLPVFWGFMAAASEAIGGFLFALGFVFRPAAAFLACVMLIATIHHLKSGDGWSVASRPFEMLAFFVGVFFVGPGRYSIDRS